MVDNAAESLSLSTSWSRQRGLISMPNLVEAPDVDGERKTRSAVQRRDLAGACLWEGVAGTAGGPDWPLTRGQRRKSPSVPFGRTGPARPRPVWFLPRLSSLARSRLARCPTLNSRRHVPSTPAGSRTHRGPAPLRLPSFSERSPASSNGPSSRRPTPPDFVPLPLRTRVEARLDPRFEHS
jgi:hypothetical protein